MLRQLDIFAVNSYHNSLPERDSDVLETYEQVARDQDEKILKFFQAHPGKVYTPWEVHEQVDSKMLIQSVRRTLTNLTKEGKLILTDIKKKERQGRNNNCWKFNPNPAQL